jgi:Cof subfamily protein (haloacid dehalogenase superfamily)
MTIGSGSGRRRPTRVLAVVSDLDGTLLRSDRTLSPATMWLLPTLRDRGIPVIVATARTPRAIRKIVGYEELGRVVCANGALLWDARRPEVIWERCFEPAGLATAVTRVRETLPGAGIALLSAETMFLDATYATLRQKGANGAEMFTDLERVVATHRVAMVAVRHPRRSAEQCLQTTAAAFSGVGEASYAGPDAVDVSPIGATKAVGAAEEMAERDCPAQATIVFGDMPNDLPLFAWAGWACAMANGHTDVLAAADEVVASNDDDGVAQHLRRLIGLGSIP